VPRRGLSGLSAVGFGGTAGFGARRGRSLPTGGRSNTIGRLSKGSAPLAIPDRAAARTRQQPRRTLAIAQVWALAEDIPKLRGLHLSNGFVLSRRQFFGATTALLGCQRARAPDVRAPLPEARPVIGLEASLAEVRHLRHVLEAAVTHPVSTHGYDHLEETEWPFFAVLFFADATTRFASLPRLGPGRRDALLEHARWALASARARGITGANPLLPKGHVLLALERFARATGSAEHRELREDLARDLEVVFERAAPTGVPPSYPTVSWTLDAAPALAALTLRGAGRASLARWESTVRAAAIDPATGLVVAGWNPERRSGIGPPRGCALMLAFPDLFDASPLFANEQWALARRHLVRSVAGVTGVREYPEPLDLPPNTDSGRIFLGLGEAASGFGLAAAAAAADMELLATLLRSARQVAPPRWNGDELSLTNVPPVGQAALLRAKVWSAETAAIAARV
jgi:hypothetical protein